MAITAALVKELRDKTGAGMMDAKKALTETDGNMESAVDWLRTKGLAKAAKKSGRTAAEGLVVVKVNGARGVAVEVNSETDFVAKNADFQNMVAGIADVALGVSDVEALKAADMGGKPVSEVLTDKIATIGENMSLRRMAMLEGENVVSYVHNAATDGMGQIGVLIAFKGDDAATARQIAMHVAAINPASLSEADLDPTLVEREKQVLSDQARESGKPEQVIEKMIEGRMKKYFSEVTLLSQQFVVNPDLTVNAAAKASRSRMRISRPRLRRLFKVNFYP
jgi:elongation factor Ts